ncbi:MAG: response regulator transcription factor [Gemmatimonadaceae bacterium]|nr:response regulator transcription factor [Gemmatimonadaceae bacterium]
MTHILLIEDNPGFAEGLRQNLEFDGYRVTVAGDVAASARAIAADAPDLIILDLMLPDGNGYDVLRTIRERDSVTPVLLLTALAEEAHKVRGFRLGADDYVTKPFGLLELLARVETLLRRSASGSFAVVRLPPVRFGDVEVDRDHRKVTRAGVVVQLTPKEYALLAALIARNSAVVERDELLREVWGYDPGVVSRTLDTHLAELRRKLERDPHRPRHILTIPKQGYRLALGNEESSTEVANTG